MTQQRQLACIYLQNEHPASDLCQLEVSSAFPRIDYTISPARKSLTSLLSGVSFCLFILVRCTLCTYFCRCLLLAPERKRGGQGEAWIE